MQNIDVTARPRSRDELAGWYTAALEDQAGSSLSMADYADELGVTAVTLYRNRPVRQAKLAPSSQMKLLSSCIQTLMPCRTSTTAETTTIGARRSASIRARNCS